MSVRKLRQLRRRCERETGVSASKVELPLLYVLADVCSALNLSEFDKRRVLGRKGTKELSNLRGSRVGLKR